MVRRRYGFLLPPLFFEVVICPLMTPAGEPLYSVCPFSSSRDIGIAAFTVPQLLKAVPDHRPPSRQRHHTIFEVIKRPALSTEPF